MTTPPRKLELPEQMEVTREGGQIVMVRRWPKFEAIIIGLFGVYVGWQIFGRYILGQWSWDHAAFDITIFAAPVIWMLYLSLAGLVNRTHIRLSREGVSVRHGPLPWLGNVRLERANLKQFYVKKAFTFYQGPLSDYKVQALLCDNKIVTAVNGFWIRKEQAAYIQSALRQAFRLTDTNPRDAIIVDAGMTIRQAGLNLEIEKRWFDRDTIRNTLILAVWLGFVGWLTWSIHTRPGAGASVSLYPYLPDLPILVPTGLLGFGVVFAYRTAADWLNRTFITVNDESLTIRHGPLPWRRGMAIAIADIRQLQVEQSSLVRRGRGPGQYVYTFQVHAVLKDGRSRMLVAGFDMSNQAQQLKREIETYLELKKSAAGGLALGEDEGIQEAWENEMLHGQPGNIPMAGMSERKREALARVMASFLGLLAISGGVWMLTYAWGLHQSGATVLNQAIPGLVAFVALSIGLMLVAIPNKLKDDHVFWVYLFWATFFAFLLMFVLLFIYGDTIRYATGHADVPAGAQVNVAVALPLVISNARLA